MATIKARLDRAAKLWTALQDKRDARNVAVLLDLGITQGMPIDAWPQNVQDGIQAHGWTLQRAYDLLQRWHDTVDSSTIIIQWMDGYEWNERTEAPMLVVQPGALAALEPDGTELASVSIDTEADAPTPEVTIYANYQPPPRPRQLFPHEREEYRRNQRPNWRVR